MKVSYRFLFCALLNLVIYSCASAQTEADVNEGLQLFRDPSSEVHTLSWWAKEGRSYFVQTSLDLETWTYLPMVEGGLGAVTGIQFMTTEDRQFWRLRYTDADNAGDAETADFDGDHVQNLVEVVQGTDPFLALDSDSDGVSDDWEITHFGGLSRNLNLDADGDGVSDAEEFAAGTDPRSWRSLSAGDGTGNPMLSVYTPLMR